MTSSSESILLLVPHVKLKKNEGELYLMTERLGWMVGNKDSFSVSHKYSDIKTQKISPEGKPKVQLQVCLHDGSATTFQFVNPSGQAEQMADRDKVKDLLQLMLPKFKRMVNKDLEEKKLFLSENPQYRQLYMDLVKSNVISAEEFWSDHATQFIKQQQETKNATQQDVGISASFLADIKPQTDGCNGGVRYLLTSDVMASIFRTYPSVKQKHLKCVPNKMTEEEFWKKFFSSHYLHRDKNINDTKDLFTDCGKQDEQVLKQDLTTAINDPLLDLTALNDVEEETSGTPSNAKINNIAHQNMIRRFNQHSILVLKASEQAAGAEPAVVEAAPPKRMRLQEALTYDDLESNESNPSVQLNLCRIERYLNGPPTTVTSQAGVNKNGSSTGQAVDPNTFKSILGRWMRGGGDRYNPLDVLSSATAVTVLGELSIGGSLMRGPQPNSAIHLTSELQKELKELYVSLSEILKHFWAAFPPSTPELVQKTNRMIDALHKFNQAKLTPYEQKLIQASTSSEAENILRPLRFQLQAAIRKHSQLSERRPLPRTAVSSM
ncbi:general transcription factor IIH subunit 1-like [Daphnia carinata]|uniref:general transcription factor IIH subunit 1-like n=1 Tax=Daphnia carinata TaxID=120202 RepID=UPI002580B5A2|nr:general transcription factor IIH subunit 1-like [Daphnia carinata]